MSQSSNAFVGEVDGDAQTGLCHEPCLNVVKGLGEGVRGRESRRGGGEGEGGEGEREEEVLVEYW